MKKKIVIAIVLAVVVLVSAVTIYFTTKSDFVINIAKPVDLSTPKYTEQIILSWGKAPSEKEENYLTEFSKAIEETQLEIATEYIAPSHIEVDVEFENGKTIVTYSGKATKKDTSELIDYNKELVFDFILTKEVNES